MDFLTSIAAVLLCGLLLGSVFSKLKLPSLIGMLLVGIVLGPHVLNLISGKLLDVSADIRQLALIIILTRAGLKLDVHDLKKNGRSAILLCFVPALCEICGYVIFATAFLKISVLDSLIMGCVMAAVSPAVIVPRMLKIQREGYGTDKGVPQMIMAGASADDVIVVILFSALVAVPTKGSFDWNVLWKLAASVILAVGAGFILGKAFDFAFKKTKMRNTLKAVVFLCVSVLFVCFENYLGDIIPFSGLSGIIAMSIVLSASNREVAEKIYDKYSKMWIVAEVFLFSLVGMEVDLNTLGQSGGMIIPVILLAMIFRIIGVFLCVVGTKLNMKERLFCMVAYTPKATVQAAIGAIPLSMGLSCGNIVLAAAVCAILITAPTGAFMIDLLYKKLLKRAEEK